MNIVFMSMDTLPSTLWVRDLYDQMHIRSDFRKWFPRMCQYGFIEGRDYEYMPRVRLQDEGGRTVQRYVKDYRITQDMAKKPMNFTDNPFEHMMRQRPGTDSGHPCKHCRHKWECGYLLHQCRKKFRSVLGDTAPPAAGAVRP